MPIRIARQVFYQRVALLAKHARQLIRRVTDCRQFVPSERSAKSFLPSERIGHIARADLFAASHEEEHFAKFQTNQFLFLRGQSCER